MNLKTLFRCLTSGLVLGGLSLVAQDSKPFSGGVALVSGLDGLKNVTNKSTGFIVDFAYTGSLAKTDIPFRAGLAYHVFPGATDDSLGAKTSLTATQLFGDLFVKTGVSNLSIVTGLSLNKYKAKVEAPGISETESIKGIKFGARFGVAYSFNASWSGELMLQVTELGVGPQADATGTVQDNARGVNPSWLQLGVKYHF